VLPDAVRSINANTFYQCSNLVSVTYGLMVTNSDGGAFSACTSLRNAYIGPNVYNVGRAAFWFCASLRQFTVHPSNPYYGAASGVLFDKGQRVLIEYPAAKMGAYTTMPVTVTNVLLYAFSGCTGLTSVALAPGVVTLGDHAFSGCTGLASASMGSSLTRGMGSSTFEGCLRLTNVVLPSSLIWVPSGIFTGCVALREVTIPASVTMVFSSAFFGCTNLSSVLFSGNAPMADPKLFSQPQTVTVYYLVDTTGWGASFAGAPTALWGPQALFNDSTFGVHGGQFGFTVIWAPDKVVVVEACTNLASPTWTPLQALYLFGGSGYFSDPFWTNYQKRFYRLRSP